MRCRPTNRSSFAGEHDLAVEVRTVAPGTELIELLSSGYPADAVLARQDDIAALGALGLLADLDHDRIPNLSLVDSDFLDLDYDPKNRWSAPARFGAYGFGYRRGLVLRPPADWAGFFDILPRYSLEGVSLLAGADRAGRRGAGRPRPEHQHRRRLGAAAGPGAARSRQSRT